MKPGNRVRVKDNLDEHCGGVEVAEEMKVLQGKIVTIEEYRPLFVGSYKYYYLIKEDKHRFCWTGEMLEPIEDIDFNEGIIK